ncbi:DUF7208 family protein [Proteus mirabilis]|uniref:DUF7208 family protein n=1 Tax=Proteus mirabilis TaxID=584 RepID=UPI0034D69750
MKRNVRTHYGNLWSVANDLGIQNPIMEHTTLNEKFNVIPDQIPKTSNGILRYFAIGNQGHYGWLSKNNIYLTASVDHYPEHAALYNHLPFVIREPGNDLDADQRRKYRMRAIITASDGKPYIAYWLKVISSENLVVQSLKSTRNPDGTITSDDWSPDSTALNPTPPKLDTNNVDRVVTSDSFLTSSAELDLSLTKADCDALLNVCRILFKDEHYALISEYALVAGVDTVVNGDDGQGGVIQYSEVIGAQAVTLLTNRGYGPDDGDRGIEYLVDYGATEPLLADSGVYAKYIATVK